MPNSALRAVIFDYGQVLSLAPRPDLFQAMADLCGVSEERFQQYYWVHRDDYDRGVLDKVSYWTPLMEEGGQPADAARLDQVAEIDAANWTRIDERMLAWVGALQAGGWRTAILSNMPDPLRQSMRERLPWLRDFTHLTFSCEVGVVKPDAAIYHHCLQGLGVAPHEALFLDDRATNVEGARQLGLAALQFHTPERLAEDLVAAGYRLPSPVEVLSGKR